MDGPDLASMSKTPNGLPLTSPSQKLRDPVAEGINPYYASAESD
jgi:hypothetical protein